MGKALASGADAAILDLEDSVPLADKAAARLLVAKTIGQAAGRDGGPAIWVRVNAAATEFLASDLEAVVRPGLDAIMLPKAETVEEVQRTAAAITRHEAAHAMKADSVEIIVMIESALGVHNCFDLIKASPRVAATCFGGARDGVFSDLNDETGLIADSRLSARLGYIGRTAIHPKQIAPVRQAYAVPESEIAYYRKVVAEFEAAEKAGSAAIAVDGKLVDYAMFERAKRVLDLAKRDAER